MLSIPGNQGLDCDGITRRELLRIGGAGMLGISLSSILELEAHAAKSPSAVKGKGGFGGAKSVILIYLQGGPSHIDIWDPKPDAPANVRGDFKPIKTNVPGIWLSEVMPQLAQQMDKATLIRSVSYTPNGSVQPYRRHVPDADRRAGRQSFPFRPAGTALPDRLPEHGIAHRQVPAARTCRCCRS